MVDEKNFLSIYYESLVSHVLMSFIKILFCGISNFIEGHNAFFIDYVLIRIFFLDKLVFLNKYFFSKTEVCPVMFLSLFFYSSMKGFFTFIFLGG